MKKVSLLLACVFIFGCSTQEKPMSTYDQQKEYLEQKEEEVEEKIKKLERLEEKHCFKIGQILKAMSESAEKTEVTDRIQLEPIEEE